MAEAKGVINSPKINNQILEAVRKIRNLPAGTAYTSGKQPVLSDTFRLAKVSDRTDDSNKYSWIAIRVNADGTFTDKAAWGSGDRTEESGFAVEINDSDQVPNGSYVLLKHSVTENVWLFSFADESNTKVVQLNSALDSDSCASVSADVLRHVGGEECWESTATSIDVYDALHRDLTSGSVVVVAKEGESGKYVVTEVKVDADPPGGGSSGSDAFLVYFVLDEQLDNSFEATAEAACSVWNGSDFISIGTHDIVNLMPTTMGGLDGATGLALGWIDSENFVAIQIDEPARLIRSTLAGAPSGGIATGAVDDYYDGMDPGPPLDIAFHDGTLYETGDNVYAVYDPDGERYQAICPTRPGIAVTDVDVCSKEGGGATARPTKHIQTGKGIAASAESGVGVTKLALEFKVKDVADSAGATPADDELVAGINVGHGLKASTVDECKVLITCYPVDYGGELFAFPDATADETGYSTPKMVDVYCDTEGEEPTLVKVMVDQYFDECGDIYGESAPYEVTDE